MVKPLVLMTAMAFVALTAIGQTAAEASMTSEQLLAKATRLQNIVEHLSYLRCH